MGRFASTVEFYSRYREAYPPEFFPKVAKQLGWCGDEALLNIGCGPGLLAIGFAPFIGSCMGLDPEPKMIESARAAAVEAGVAISLKRGRIEDFSTSENYDVITIGRALHWLERNATLAVLEQIVSDSGRILICAASSLGTPESLWVKPYAQVLRAWASGPDERQYRIDGKKWFEGTCFVALGDTAVTTRHRVTISDLIGRALSRSNTSPEIVGDGRAEFEEEITAALQPFVRDGYLIDHIAAKASLFERIPG